MKSPAKFLTTALAALACASAIPAQKMQVFGGSGERMASTLVFFSDDFSISCGVFVQYGQPEWKDSYNDQLDKMKGTLQRLGKDWWTTFDTSTPIEIGGTKIPPGSYVLGIACDANGKFSLAVRDATVQLKEGHMPFEQHQSWKPDFSVPLELKKDAVTESVQKMKIELTANEADSSKATFTISWGKHKLTADVKITFPTAKNAGDKKADKGDKGEKNDKGGKK